MFLLWFLYFVHVDSSPTAWAKVDGAKQLEYRWSRPATNACDLELRGENSSASSPLVARIVVTYQPEPDIVRRRGDTSKKEQSAEQAFELKMPAGQVKRLHVESCFGLNSVRGSVEPQRH